jgi:hypothetical protein
LRWTPPPLTDPITIDVPAHEPTYNAITHLNLDNARDYIVKLPRKKKVGALTVRGGRNVHIIGGHITANPEHLTDNSDPTIGTVPLRVLHNYGTVHIEGILIDDSVGGQSDAFEVSAPYSTVQIQNVRVERISGSHDQVHADLIKLGRGDVKELRVDRFTGFSNYAGFQFDRWGPTAVSNTNIGYKPSPYVADQGGGNFLWVTATPEVSSTGSFSCETSGHSLSEVYVQAKPGWNIGQSVSPWVGSTWGCPSQISEDGKSAWWPNLLTIEGVVKLGPPTGGDFVPPGVAGARYVSPRYR